MKRRQWLILGIGSLVVLVLLMFLFQRRDSDEGKSLSRRPAVSKPVREHTAPGPSVRVTPAPPQPVPVERGTGVAVVASSRMVEQRPVEFSNLVNVIWSAELGTVFAAEDAGSASVKVPAGMDVNTLQQALLRCAMSLLLWDEDVNQDTIKALKGYCETGGWLVFVSCPWIGSPPKSSPAELLGPRSFEGIAHVGAASQNRKAFALLKHPSLPELPVGERLRVYLQSSKALSGGEGRKIPLIRFEDPALR
ncbi:MAG: hypothetical protein Q8Q12_14615, partial [bacterium]|nr:hypothetical protein [bacterium]